MKSVKYREVSPAAHTIQSRYRISQLVVVSLKPVSSAHVSLSHPTTTGIVAVQSEALERNKRHPRIVATASKRSTCTSV